MLIVALARLAAWLSARVGGWWADRQEPPWPPELLDLDRQASVAMTMCTCGHIWHLHQRPHVRTSCSACACQRFRPAPQTQSGTSSPT